MESKFGRGLPVPRDDRDITKAGAHFYLAASSRHTAVSIMTDRSQGPKGRDSVLSSLNMAIGALNRAKETTNATPAKATFTSAGILLTMIRVGFLPVNVC